MAFGCRYAAGRTRWEPRDHYAGTGAGAGSPSQRSGQHTGCRPCVAPRPRLRRSMPHIHPGPRLRRMRADPCRACRPGGRYQRPPSCCTERPPVDHPDGAKSAVGMCGPRVSLGLSPWATTPLEYQVFQGYVGHVAHRWPTKKATSGPSESHERLDKAKFSTRNIKNRPRDVKGHKGADTRPTSWPAWSAQPTALTSRVAMLRSSSPLPLPSVGALTARPGVAYAAASARPPVRLPSLRSGAHSADAYGVLLRRRSRRPPHVRSSEKAGPGCRRATYLAGMKGNTRPPHGLSPTRRGLRPGTPGRSLGRASRHRAWHAPPAWAAPVRRGADQVHRGSEVQGEHPDAAHGTCPRTGWRPCDGASIRCAGGNRTWRRRAGCPPQREHEKNENYKEILLCFFTFCCSVPPLFSASTT